MFLTKKNISVMKKHPYDLCLLHLPRKVECQKCGVHFFENTGKTPAETYANYKTRGQVETMIDAKIGNRTYYVKK